MSRYYKVRLEKTWILKVNDPTLDNIPTIENYLKTHNIDLGDLNQNIWLKEISEGDVREKYLWEDFTIEPRNHE